MPMIFFQAKPEPARLAMQALKRLEIQGKPKNPVEQIGKVGKNNEKWWKS